MKILFLAFLLMAGSAQAGEPDYERLADSIFRAEGGVKASRPYGVFYKGCDWKREAFCRRVCINTIRNAFKRYYSEASPLPFISYLGRTYAPVGAKNDPGHLNEAWTGNVEAIYAQLSR